jgi:hypothetical protein
MEYNFLADRGQESDRGKKKLMIGPVAQFGRASDS